MHPLAVVAPHSSTWLSGSCGATGATVGPSGRPRTRVLHPIWEFAGGQLIGWIATSPRSP